MKQCGSFYKLFCQELPFVMALPALLWQIIFLYIPLLLMIVYSLTTTAELSLSSITTAYYTKLINPLYLTIIIRSLLLALGNAVVCVVLAYPVAYYLAFHVTRFKNYFLLFLILPFWISSLVQVYAWFFVLEKHGLINSLLLYGGIISQPLQLLNTIGAVALVLVYSYIPFAIMPIYSSLEKFDKHLLEASADLGATQWQTFVRVTLPLSTLGLRTAFFLVLVPSFGEFIIPTLLSGGKQWYVGSLISYYFSVARNVHEGAAFTWISGIALIMASVSIYLLFRLFLRNTD